jgi:hypothetical protein
MSPLWATACVELGVQKAATTCLWREGISPLEGLRLILGRFGREEVTN